MTNYFRIAIAGLLSLVAACGGDNATSATSGDVTLLFTIDDLDGTAAQATHFADGGTFDKIYAK